MKSVPRSPIILALALLGTHSSGASAQLQSATSSLPTTGFVDVPVSGGGVRDLDFGVLVPGVARVIAVNSASSAKWEFSNIPNNNGQNNRFADLSFSSLPAQLTGPGGATIPMSSFVVRVALAKGGTDYYSYGDFTVTPASPTIDPNPRINPTGGAGQPPAAPGGNTGRSLVVYLGATVTPATWQRAGNYIGTLTLIFNTSSAT